MSNSARHSRSSTNSVPKFICPVCAQLYSARSLRSHILQFHNETKCGMIAKCVNEECRNKGAEIYDAVFLYDHLLQNRHVQHKMIYPEKACSHMHRCASGTDGLYQQSIALGRVLNGIPVDIPTNAGRVAEIIAKKKNAAQTTVDACFVDDYNRRRQMEGIEVDYVDYGGNTTPGTSRTPNYSAHSPGRSPGFYGRSPGMSPGFAGGRSPGMSTGRYGGRSPGMMSPGRFGGRSPGMAGGRSPGMSPGRFGGRSPGMERGRSPGMAPGRSYGRSPGREDHYGRGGSTPSGAWDRNMSPGMEYQRQFEGDNGRHSHGNTHNAPGMHNQRRDDRTQPMEHHNSHGRNTGHRDSERRAHGAAVAAAPTGGVQESPAAGGRMREQTFPHRSNSHNSGSQNTRREERPDFSATAHSQATHDPRAHSGSGDGAPSKNRAERADSSRSRPAETSMERDFSAADHDARAHSGASDGAPSKKNTSKSRTVETSMRDREATAAKKGYDTRPPGIITRSDNPGKNDKLGSSIKRVKAEPTEEEDGSVPPTKKQATLPDSTTDTVSAASAASAAAAAVTLNISAETVARIAMMTAGRTAAAAGAAGAAWNVADVPLPPPPPAGGRPITVNAYAPPPPSTGFPPPPPPSHSGFQPFSIGGQRYNNYQHHGMQHGQQQQPQQPYGFPPFQPTPMPPHSQIPLPPSNAMPPNQPRSQAAPSSMNASSIWGGGPSSSQGGNRGGNQSGYGRQRRY